MQRGLRGTKAARIVFAASLLPPIARPCARFRRLRSFQAHQVMADFKLSGAEILSKKPLPLEEARWIGLEAIQWRDEDGKEVL